MSGTSEGPTPAADLDRSAVTESDNTYRKSYEKTEQKTYEYAFEAATLPMAVVDREGLVTTANEAFATLIGADPAGRPRRRGAGPGGPGHPPPPHPPHPPG
ncbi:PAS domain-containing protein, partial [Streptomyces sp. NPDC059627]